MWSSRRCIFHPQSVLLLLSQRVRLKSYGTKTCSWRLFFSVPSISGFRLTFSQSAFDLCETSLPRGEKFVFGPKNLQIPRSWKMTAEIWDVVIVGAGLSGLSAAHYLRKRDAKLKILILEGKGLFHFFNTSSNPDSWDEKKAILFIDLLLINVCLLCHTDRVGGRTVSSEIPAANGGTDVWDFGGQWVARWAQRHDY